MKQPKQPKAKRKRPRRTGPTNAEIKANGRRTYQNAWSNWTNKGYPTPKKKKGVKPKPYPFPSRYGSHSSMVVAEFLAVTPTGVEDCLLLQDEWGQYLTTPDRIDNGLADPNRCEGRGSGFEEIEYRKVA